MSVHRVALAGGMLHLFRSGDILIASLILLFTIIFPVAKLVALFILIHADNSTAQKLLGTLAHLGKWPMLDVFVIALVVISFKNFLGGSRVESHWGLYVFAISVLVSMMATVLLKQVQVLVSNSSLKRFRAGNQTTDIRPRAWRS